MNSPVYKKREGSPPGLNTPVKRSRSTDDSQVILTSKLQLVDKSLNHLIVIIVLFLPTATATAIFCLLPN
jgi:hypothetical protein